MNYKFNSKVIGLVLIGAVSVTSCGIKKVPVKKTPSSSIIFKYEDNLLLSGYPKYSKPWIVFADKEKAVVYPTKNFDQADKKANFIEPFIVLRKKGDMYKVAKYEPGSIVENKIDKELLKGYGWLHKDDLLLWNESLKNEVNGFRLKGILAINDKDVIEKSQKYIQKDSVLIYKEPSLINKADIKLPINDIVYIYKFSDDSKKALIGGVSILEVDQPDSKLYGWIDTKILSIWGERTGFKIKTTKEDNKIQLGVESPEGTSFNSVINSSKVTEVNDLGHINALGYVKQDNDFEIRYLDNVLDYRENKVYNVLGRAIYYNAYREILANNRKLNLVFVIDGSRENFSSLAALRSVVQDFELQMSKQDYFDQVTFSATYYNVDREYQKEYVNLSRDYNELSNALDKRFFSNTRATSNLSLSEAINDVNHMLISNLDQTNLVVVLGNTLDQKDKLNQSALINNLARINSRVVFYQLKANRNDNYNDFVLFGERVIMESSKEVSKNKKQKLVNHEDVLQTNQFDLSQGEMGIYRLDYPNNSMNQGAIVFPRKGEENRPVLLQNVIEKTLSDIVLDNQNIDSTLTNFFKSPIGVSYTKVKSEYLPWYKQDKTYVSTDIAMPLIDKDYSFIVKGKLKKQDSNDYQNIEYGVLLDDFELEQIRNYYLSIYANVFRNNTLTNRRLIRRYMSVVRDKSLLHEGVSRSFLRENPMHIGLFQSTGLYLPQADSLSSMKLNKWKRKKIMNPIMLQHYFRSFKDYADKIVANKGNKEVMFNHHGTSFYWLSYKYLPVLDYSTSKEYDNSFDILPVELEKIKAGQENKDVLQGNSKEYIERVKKGMP
ncbi:type VI secretion system protein TssR domain-containing protein [Myroides odoratimimus]|uniref:type VI secretion system protein TssR domain-containing protein n=1 Tax=Myroides odoratimimus TaxID=76832 RepID=UPI00091EFD97|nr:type VI secretion system protein TssR domain-containing protein [Myroides odoratimimus]SHL55607.1 hypothetical protein SAMN05444275_10510 [Myroides odoratimimus subsp. xuanwuensis]